MTARSKVFAGVRGSSEQQALNIGQLLGIHLKRSVPYRCLLAEGMGNSSIPPAVKTPTHTTVSQVILYGRPLTLSLLTHVFVGLIVVSLPYAQSNLH